MTQTDGRDESKDVPPRRSDVDRIEQQLRGMEQFHRSRRMREQAAQAVSGSREMQMNAARELDVTRRETDALIARSEEQLRSSGQEPLGTAACTVLLAHRNAWYVGQVCGALVDVGCVVLPQVRNGADAVGLAAAEQPDLVLVEDALEMLTGEEVVRQIRELCPNAVIVAQVAYGDGIGAMTDAGASAVFTRQVPPAEVAQGLLSLIGR